MIEKTIPRGSGNVTKLYHELCLAMDETSRFRFPLAICGKL